MRKMGGGDLKFSRGFTSYTRKKIPPATQAITSGRVLSPISLISFLTRLLKALHGSITVIKLATKVSNIK